MKAKLLPAIFCFFTFSAFAQTKEARLIDEFGELSCDEIIARVQYAITEAYSDQGSVALFYVYEGKHIFDYAKKSELPRFGESAARTRTMQTRLDFLKIDPKYFIFADGGFREKYWVEVWVVPQGSRLPKASPTLETIKYRKGTPTDICDGF